MGGSKKQTVGYKYFMGLHLGVCHGPVDKLREIRVGDKQVWTGSQTSSGTISIDKPNLFGGTKKEGGIQGTLYVQFGDAAQTPHVYLQSQLGEDIPAFRGFLGLIYNGLVACNNPYIKAWAVRAERILAGWNSSGGTWYSAKAVIGDGHMNPAHMIYQCLTDPVWGMGYSTLTIDDDSFTAAADELYDEDFGLSLLWTRQTSIEDFVQMVVDHIGAALNLDLATGTFTLKLIRDDYDVETIPALDESNVVELVKFERAAWVDTINELRVVYTDVANNKPATVQLQDLASITAQGGVVSQERQYPGIPSEDLALRVAERDLLAASTPLSRVQLRVNRELWNLTPGEVFRLSWDKLGLTSVVYRVGNVSIGTLTDPTMTIDAVEDVFSLPTQTYAAQQPTGWTEPPTDPVAASYRLLREVPYYDQATQLAPADFNALTPLTGYVHAMGVRPFGGCFNFGINTKVGGASYQRVDEGDFVPSATLAAGIDPTTTAITLAGGIDLELVEEGIYAIIGTEYVRVDAIDVDANTATIARGVLDTHPATHALGARIHFARNFGGQDPTEYEQGETVDVRLTPTASGGELDVASAPTDSITIEARADRPYPPQKIQIGGSYFPTVIDGEVAVTWAHRDRTQQLAAINAWTDGDIGPEVGVEYELRFYTEAGVLIHTESGITDTDWTLPIASETTNVCRRVDAISTRDGLDSWQTFSHTFDRAGFGMSFGEYFGGV